MCNQTKYKESILNAIDNLDHILLNIDDGLTKEQIRYRADKARIILADLMEEISNE